MAYVGSVNNAITHGGASDQLFALKTALLAAGWTVAQSGVTGGGVASSDLLTTVALFNTTGAWVRMQEPAGSPVKREYILQMGTAGTANGLIKYSRQTGFISGTPTATLAPNTGVGGDGQIIVGGGTEANPTSTPLAQATGYAHAIASDTLSGGSSYGGYAFYMVSHLAAPTLAGIYMMFSEPVAVGSTSSLDRDPTIRYAGAPNTLVSQGTAAFSWWQAYGLGVAGTSYITGGYSGIPCCYGGNTSTLLTLTSVSPYDSKVPLFTLPVGKPTFIPKGYTTGVSQFNTAQNLLDTFNLSTPEARLVVGNAAGGGYSVAIPWITNAIPLV